MKTPAMPDVPSVLREIRLLADRGDGTQIGARLEQTAAEFPDSVEILSHLGYFYYKSGRSTQALLVFSRRLALAPPDAELCEILSEIHERRGEYAPALEWLRRAIRLGNTRSDLRFRRIRLSHKAKRQRLRSRLKRSPFFQIFFSNLRSILFGLSVGLVRWIEAVYPEWAAPEKGTTAFRLSEYLDFLRRYDTDHRQEGIAYHKNREVLVSSRWLPYSRPGAVLLDLGTGKNALPLFWASRGSTAVALDGSLYGFSVLRRIQQRFLQTGAPDRVRFAAGDMRTLPFRDNAFDGVSSLCAVEHIPGDGDVETLREVYRVLKPGGRAVITVEACRTASDSWLEVPYEIGYQAGPASSGTAAPERREWEEVFCRNYSPETFRDRLVAAAPWKVIDTGFYDDRRLPLRRWFGPENRHLLSRLLRPFQPFFSLLFYRPAWGGELSPSGIGYLVVEKPL